ncbi:patatin-like phospholipase family protein [Patescibacteria group bacterium]
MFKLRDRLTEALVQREANDRLYEMQLHLDSELIKNLHRKRMLLEAGDERHKKIRPVLLALGGGMKGACGGGIMYALRLLELADVFDIVVSMSVGAICSIGFLAGKEESQITASYFYWKEFTDNFIRYSRQPIMNLDMLEAMMRSGEKQISVEKAKASRPEFFVGVTDPVTGAGEIIDAKNALPDLATAVKASSALYGIYSTEDYRKVIVNGKHRIDGTYANPFPIKEVIEMFNPTDVLVIPNRSIEQNSKGSVSLAEKLFTDLFVKNEALKRTILARRQTYSRSLEFAKKVKDVRIGFIWNPVSLSSLTRNRKVFYNAVNRSVKDTLRIFGSSLPYELIPY